MARICQCLLFLILCLFNFTNLYLIMLTFFGYILWYSVCVGGTVFTDLDEENWLRMVGLPVISILIVSIYMFFRYIEDFDDPEDAKQLHRARSIKAPERVTVDDVHSSILKQQEQRRRAYLVVTQEYIEQDVKLQKYLEQNSGV